MPEKTTGEGIAALPERFQPGTPSYQNLLIRRLDIIDALEKILPTLHLVEFIKNQQSRIGEPFRLVDDVTVGKVVIVEVHRLSDTFGNRESQTCLAHLARPSDENHF